MGRGHARASLLIPIRTERVTVFCSKGARAGRPYTLFFEGFRQGPDKEKAQKGNQMKDIIGPQEQEDGNTIEADN